MIIDIHTHILPAYDDGAVDEEMTRKMLHQAYEGGTREIVSTSHVLSNADYDRKAEILEKFETVRQIVAKENLDLTLYLGSEIYMHPDTVIDHPISTFNNNRKYALVEFSLRSIPEFVPEMLFNWVMAGYKPILAHPERNLKIAEIPAYAYKFCQMGVLLQMNGGSLLGVFGERARKTSHLLMDHNMIHFIASDGHNVDTRPIYLGDVYDYVADHWGKERADELMYKNPKKAILGEPIEIREPTPIREDKRKPNKIWNLLKKLGLK
jgi:protein-tyrosine phosphatase